MNIKPNIYEYSDYRAFLKAFYECSKREKRHFSYRYFARKIGCASPNYLHLIIAGKRNLTENYVHRFSYVLGLSKKEHQYFDALVSFNQAKTPETRIYYLELMQNFSKSKAGVLLSSDQYEYISHWYYPVVRELILLPGFKESPTWIRKKLRKKITLKEARGAIALLLRLDLARRNENGELYTTDKHVVTENEVADVAAYSFHQQMLSLAKEILTKTKGGERDVSGMTIAISDSQVKNIKNLIHDFQKEIMQYLDENPNTSNNIYQINVQFLPITITTKEEMK